MNSVSRFVENYGAWALASERYTGIPALFTLAQSALETGWGNAIKGNNMFGIKDTDGINGNEVQVLTTEYHRKTGWEKIKAWFRKYPSPKQSFDDHARFFLENPRYQKALLVKSDPVKFAEEVAAAGYATDPTYALKIITIMKMIKPHLSC